MNDTIIYDNPAIRKPVFLFVAVHEVEHRRGRWTIIKFQVEPRKFKANHLHARLAHTPATEGIWQKFRATFLFSGYKIETALGKWGKVYLVPSKFQDLEYSSVQPIIQKGQDRMRSADLDRRYRIDPAVDAPPLQPASENETLLQDAVALADEKIPSLF